MTTILIIYAVGVLLNAFIAASIYDDLKEDFRLVRVRTAVLMCCILASFATWLYMIFYLLISMFKKPKDKDDGKQEEKASGV